MAPAAADPAMVASSSAPSPFYMAEHEAFRQTVRRFVDREIMPFVDQWDEAEEFPRELYGKADRKSTRLNSSHIPLSRMPSSA